MANGSYRYHILLLAHSRAHRCVNMYDEFILSFSLTLSLRKYSIRRIRCEHIILLATNDKDINERLNGENDFSKSEARVCAAPAVVVDDEIA